MGESRRVDDDRITHASHQDRRGARGDADHCGLHGVDRTLGVRLDAGPHRAESRRAIRVVATVGRFREADLERGRAAESRPQDLLHPGTGPHDVAGADCDGGCAVGQPIADRGTDDRLRDRESRRGHPVHLRR